MEISFIYLVTVITSIILCLPLIPNNPLRPSFLPFTLMFSCPCRSCAGSHRCCVFMMTSASSYSEDSVSWHASHLLAMTASVPSFPSCPLGPVENYINVLHSQQSLKVQNFDQLWVFLLTIGPSQKKHFLSRLRKKKN